RTANARRPAAAVSHPAVAGSWLGTARLENHLQLATASGRYEVGPRYAVPQAQFARAGVGGASHWHVGIDRLQAVLDAIATSASRQPASHAVCASSPFC